MNDMSVDITQILEALAESQPAAPALHVAGRTSLSYADLGAQIRYVRERLNHWGIERGDVIAGLVPSSARNGGGLGDRFRRGDVRSPEPDAHHRCVLRPDGAPATEGAPSAG